jgi:hypothetical protein
LDDPARVDRGTDFDPNYDGQGQMEAISAIYHQIDQLIVGLGQINRQQNPGAHGLVVNEILNLFVDAELEHAEDQGVEGFWDTTVDLDVEDTWSVQNRGQYGERWWKTNQPG